MGGVDGSQKATIAALETSERKLAMMFGFLHKYLEKKFDSGAFADEQFMFLKAQ